MRRFALLRFAALLVLTGAAITSTGAAQQRVTELGGELNRGGAEFGFVKDVAIDSLRRVLVLDSKTHLVYAFDSSGRGIAQFAGNGRGPGELIEASALDVGADSTVFVLDWRQRRIATFAPMNRGYAHRIDYRIPGSATLGDICLSNGAIFGYGIASDTTPIQVFRIQGDTLVRERGIGGTEFGRDLGPRLQLLPVFANGRLACAPRHGVVVWALENVAEIRFVDSQPAYTQRAHPIRSFTEMRVSFDTEQNTVRFRYGENGRSDHTVAAAVVGDSAVVLTIGTQGQGDVRREYRSFQTQTMVLEGERVHHRARATTAAILGASVKDLAVCYVNDPLPTVWIVRGAGLLAGCPADLLGQARN